MMNVGKAMMSDIWTATAQRAAAEARWLRPLALTLFVMGLLMTLQGMAGSGDACVVDMAENGRRFSVACALREIGAGLVQAGPALALLWALWEAQAYLKRMESGEAWAPSTMKLFGRIGDCLLAAAIWMGVVTPTLSLWIAGRGGFEWNLDATILTLGGLGIVLTAIARVLGDMLSTAEAAKADSDAIV